MWTCRRRPRSCGGCCSGTDRRAIFSPALPKSLESNGPHTERVLIPTRRVLIPTRNDAATTRNDAATTRNDAAATHGNVTATRRSDARIDTRTGVSIGLKRAVRRNPRRTGQATDATRRSVDARAARVGPALGPTRVTRTCGFARTSIGATARHRPFLFGAMASSAVMTLLQGTSGWLRSSAGDRRRYTGAGAGSCGIASSFIGNHPPPMLGVRSPGASEKMFTKYVLWSKYVAKVFTNYPRPSGRGIFPPETGSVPVPPSNGDRPH